HDNASNADMHHLRLQDLSLLRLFFPNPATTDICTLSLHDALPICRGSARWDLPDRSAGTAARVCRLRGPAPSELRDGLSWLAARSEEHTSELQSPCNLVCRLLLEKKNYAETPAEINALIMEITRRH